MNNEPYGKTIKNVAKRIDIGMLNDMKISRKRQETALRKSLCD